jgi:hypothetical protein
MPGALPELLFASTGGDDARVGRLEHPPTLGVNLAQINWEGQVSTCHIAAQVADQAWFTS